MTRYRATTTPQAAADFLAIPFGATKTAVRRLFAGEEPQSIVTEADIEDVPGAAGCWSWLRVNERLIKYRPLSAAERRELHREDDILVDRILLIGNEL